MSVTLPDEELRSAVQVVLPPGSEPCDLSDPVERFALVHNSVDTYSVKVGDAPVLQHGSLDVALGMLDAQIRMYVAARARKWVFVHAGVVALGDAALVMPGESFSGKTTLVSSMIKAGAVYLSDEYAVLDAAGQVHPYPRRLSIRNGDGTTDETHFADLGAVAGDKCATVAMIVVSRYRPGAKWSPNVLSTGQGILAVLEHTASARDRPSDSLHTVSKAVSGATVLEGERDDAEAIASPLLEHLATLTP